MNRDEIRVAGPDGAALETVDAAPADPAPPWEEISPGRFMPRRVRGSYPGRVLG